MVRLAGIIRMNKVTGVTGVTPGLPRVTDDGVAMIMGVTPDPWLAGVTRVAEVIVMMGWPRWPGWLGSPE